MSHHIWPYTAQTGKRKKKGVNIETHCRQSVAMTDAFVPYSRSVSKGCTFAYKAPLLNVVEKRELDHHHRSCEKFSYPQTRESVVDDAV